MTSVTSMTSMTSMTSLVRESIASMRARPWALSALGLASVSSVAAICCGLGLLSMPFFLTEIALVQLAYYGPVPAVSPRSRLSAMAVQWLAVLVAVAAVLLSAVGFGSGYMPAAAEALAHEALRDAVSAEQLARILASALVSGILWLPLIYAPVLLLSGRFHGFAALAESARLVVVHGIGFHIRLWLVVVGLAWLPALMVGVLAYALIGVGAWAWTLLASAAMLAVTAPLGQGLVVAANVQLRGREESPAITRWPWSVRVVYAALIALPVMSSWLLLLSLWAPAPLAPGALALPGGQRLSPAAGSGAATRLYLEGSALTVEVEERSVSVVASDGGGAGGLPLPEDSAVQCARAVPVRGGFAIEVQQATATSHTYIDHAGVRQDDQLRDRLADRLPRSERWAWVFSSVLLYLGTWPMLAQLGAAQRGGRPTDNIGRRARQRAAWLLPLLAFVVYWPLAAFLRTWM